MIFHFSAMSLLVRLTLFLTSHTHIHTHTFKPKAAYIFVRMYFAFLFFLFFLEKFLKHAIANHSFQNSKSYLRCLSNRKKVLTLDTRVWWLLLLFLLPMSMFVSFAREFFLSHFLQVILLFITWKKKFADAHWSLLYFDNCFKRHFTLTQWRSTNTLEWVGLRDWKQFDSHYGAMRQCTCKFFSSLKAVIEYE